MYSAMCIYNYRKYLTISNRLKLTLICYLFAWPTQGILGPKAKALSEAFSYI
jgi:hypothetical protein